jgi:multiple sugar transport system ATP-binding protein
VAAVDLKNISKAYGATAVLRDVSLTIEDGEFLALLGPSGCGKSTLLRIIAGLEPQDSGSVAIGGTVVDAAKPKTRGVAMVFQSYALYPHMTTAENMALPLRMRRLSALQRFPLMGRFLPGSRTAVAGIADDVRRVAEALDIVPLLDRKPRQLSGGQRQRVALGRAMVRQPAVFLMDEPLSNLDAAMRASMRAEIKELHRRLGVTFIYVTHDQAEAMTLADRVAVMLEGELVQVAGPREIYARPADRRVAEFIGSPRINLIEGRVRDAATVVVAGTTLTLDTALLPGAPVTIGIRPEGLSRVAAAQPDSLSGRVRLVEHLGSDVFVHLALGENHDALIARLPGDLPRDPAIGDVLHVAARPDSVLLFSEDGRRLPSQRSRLAANECAA